MDGLTVLIVIFTIAVVWSVFVSYRNFLQEEKERLQKEADAKLKVREYQALIAAPLQADAFSFKCWGHPNRTLAMRYGLLNQSHAGGRLIENDTIQLIKQGYVKGFEDRGHYWAKLVDFDNTKVRVVIDEGADYINTFYPINDREWFDNYAPVERILKNAEAFSLKELAKYHLDLVVIPELNKRGEVKE